MNSDRFKEPNATDDLAPCHGCGRTYYIISLDDSGLCSDCQPEELVPSTAEVSEVEIADSTKIRGVRPPLSLD